MKIFFLVWGATLALGLGAYHFFGYSFTSVEEQQVTPKTVRENPGSYRTHYFGGK